MCICITFCILVNGTVCILFWVTLKTVSFCWRMEQILIAFILWKKCLCCIMLARIHYRQNFVLVLIGYGADVHVTFNGESCLHGALSQEKIIALLKAGLHPDIRAWCICGNTPVAYTTDKIWKYSITQGLVWTVGMMIKIAHLIMLFTTVRMLLDKGADPHVRNAKNAIILWTAVSNAYKYCHNARSVEIVKMLLQKKKCWYLN